MHNHVLAMRMYSAYHAALLSHTQLPYCCISHSDKYINDREARMEKRTHIVPEPKTHNSLGVHPGYTVAYNAAELHTETMQLLIRVIS